jgi:GDP-4-dehydro-6-deoxy-D-mannose reductase
MLQRRVLITGVNGFVGQHLVRELASEGIGVVGIGMDTEPATAVAGLLSDYVQADLTREWPRMPQVTGMVHLAALSAIGPSFERPQEYIATNSAMLTNLAEHLLGQDEQPRVLVVSSGAVYDPCQSPPIAESGRLAFGSPYAVSKVLTENQAAYYVQRGLDVVVARPFNHVGPGQSRGFVLPDLLAAAREAAGTRLPMRVGDLSTRRDYTDVRDVARAYRLLLTAVELKDRLFNVCSGTALAGTQLLDWVLEFATIDNVQVITDATRLRPDDPREIVGTHARVSAAVGWHPLIDVRESVRELVMDNPCL